MVILKISHLAIHESGIPLHLFVSAEFCYFQHSCLIHFKNIDFILFIYLSYREIFHLTGSLSKWHNSLGRARLRAGSHTWVTEAQVLAICCLPHFTGRGWIESGAARTEISAHVGSWHHRQQLYVLCCKHRSGPYFTHLLNDLFLNI